MQDQFFQSGVVLTRCYLPVIDYGHIDAIRVAPTDTRVVLVKESPEEDIASRE